MIICKRCFEPMLSHMKGKPEACNDFIPDHVLCGGVGNDFCECSTMFELKDSDGNKLGFDWPERLRYSWIGRRRP